MCENVTENEEKPVEKGKKGKKGEKKELLLIIEEGEEGKDIIDDERVRKDFPRARKPPISIKRPV